MTKRSKSKFLFRERAGGVSAYGGIAEGSSRAVWVKGFFCVAHNGGTVKTVERCLLLQYSVVFPTRGLLFRPFYDAFRRQNGTNS